jgi:glycosyltransferase involved in cell wall biosynthesis
MACGTPVIMSSLVASAEIIDDGIDGFIQDPRDAEGLAECILSALKSQNLVENMRSHCRTKIIDRFSLIKVVSDNIHFYEKCLK